MHRVPAKKKHKRDFNESENYDEKFECWCETEEGDGTNRKKYPVLK